EKATKVKSGCRTCKTRKVKCDEGRPACARCLSSGRVCQGYGIWGGGNTSLDLVRSGPIKHVLSTITPESKDELCCLEWFRGRTAVKLQGPFGSSFWGSLVIRASLEEPSIFCAMQALRSVHKRVTVGVAGLGSEGDPDRLEQFTLRQYSKAINHLLQPQFVSGDKASLRVALISCMLL
ncbi:uncharacterized protein BCR38DRAFT_310326, partial [Pseudomassariella vexata]